MFLGPNSSILGSLRRRQGMPVSALPSFTMPPAGRLTLTSGTPVLTSTVSGATVIYYTPYLGNFAPVTVDGTNFLLLPFAELSNTTTATTPYAGPAAVAASSVYDLFVWLVSPGVFAISRGPAWTNSTTRSAGTALTRVNGILVNSVGITNGPPAGRGTYVGTIASNGSSTIDYIFGASASGGIAAVHNVWNMYNRVDIGTSVTDNGGGYTYTGSTVRQARASAGNQISFVLGQQEDSIPTSYTQNVITTAALNAFGSFGFGFDSTSTYPSTAFAAFVDAETAASLTDTKGIASQWSPRIGVHTLSANEAGDGSNANTFGSGGTTGNPTLTAIIRM